MKKLTECKSYEELEEEIIRRGLDSKAVATNILQYLKTKAFYEATDDNIKATKSKEVHDWLCKYRDEHNKGQTTLPCKELAVKLLLEGKSVKEVHSELLGKGYSVSRNTLYKYKRKLNGWK